MSNENIKVLLSSPFSPMTGYGRDGIDMARAFMRAGLDVYMRPSHVDPPLPKDIAALLTKRLVAPFDLILCHRDPMGLQLTPEETLACDFSVAWSMWERSSLDNSEYKARKSFKKRIKYFDLLLAYDPVTREAFEPYIPKRGPRPELKILQGGFEPDYWQPVERDWYTPGLNYCMVGQLNPRKDPFVAINAFLELWDEHPEFRQSRLNLKTTVPGLHSRLNEICSGIHVYYESWSTEKLKSFYSQHHMLLAPSRGEGKHLPSLEFQTNGGAVAATNWGGMSMWISNEYAYPLDYKVAPVHPSLPNCMEARCSKESLKAAMWDAFTNRAELNRKAELAQKIIPEQCNWDTVTAKLFELIGEQPKGIKLYNKFKILQTERMMNSV